MKNPFQNIFRKKHLTLLILLSAVHSVFLVFISLWLVNRHFVYGDEKMLFQVTAGVKKIILGIEEKPDPADYIFINVCYDNMLIPMLDEEGFPVGNQPIVDRRKLALFFERLNRRPDSYKYAVSDIFFKDSSSADSLLYSKIKDTKNLIIPYHINDTGGVEYPVFDINRGLADYSAIQYVFMKYPLVTNDTMKSLPLKMYEDITGKKFEKKKYFSYLGGKPCFNNMIVDFKLRYYELLDRNSEKMYNLVNLGDILRLPDTAFYKSVGNKIIFLGDYYERDLHQTLFGKMSGTLILFNIYFSLLKNENLISFGLVLLLFIGFFAVSYNLFSEMFLKERKYTQKISRTKFGKFILKVLSFVVYLMFISVITYFIFNIHINILILAFYLKGVDSLIKYIRNKKQKKEIKSGEEKGELNEE
ncbi:MAG: CHASE2 domain-containing protein [Ignavibacteriae bacterium]|nr:CHASE2 domain-containing protein [Ignavibacteriota bacterium]